jgi:hypothetical protein
MKNLIFSYILGFLLFFSFTCKKNISSLATEETDNNIYLNRITFYGMDSVAIGDSPEWALKVLGKPDQAGIGCGLYSYLIYDYLTGEHAGFSVDFLQTDIGLDFDYAPAVTLMALPPYKGKTAEGIGLGSHRSEVHDLYGVPFKTYFSGENDIDYDIYEYSNISYISFYYKNEYINAVYITAHEDFFRMDN